MSCLNKIQYYEVYSKLRVYPEAIFHNLSHAKRFVKEQQKIWVNAKFRIKSVLRDYIDVDPIKKIKYMGMPIGAAKTVEQLMWRLDGFSECRQVVEEILTGWTEWRCSKCNTIIYNTDLGCKIKVLKHEKTHKRKN